jgi:hypothetical protein
MQPIRTESNIKTFKKIFPERKLKSMILFKMLHILRQHKHTSFINFYNFDRLNITLIVIKT